MHKIVQSKHMEENARGEWDMSFTGNMGRKTQDKVDSSKASQDTWIKRCKVSLVTCLKICKTKAKPPARLTGKQQMVPEERGPPESAREEGRGVKTRGAIVRTSGSRPRNGDHARLLWPPCQVRRLSGSRALYCAGSHGSHGRAKWVDR